MFVNAHYLETWPLLRLRQGLSSCACIWHSGDLDQNRNNHGSPIFTFFLSKSRCTRRPFRMYMRPRPIIVHQFSTIFRWVPIGIGPEPGTLAITTACIWVEACVLVLRATRHRRCSSFAVLVIYVVFSSRIWVLGSFELIAKFRKRVTIAPEWKGWIFSSEEKNARIKRSIYDFPSTASTTKLSAPPSKVHTCKFPVRI